MSLLDRHLDFVGALRTAGLPISLAEGVDAARSLEIIDLIDRDALRAAYAATLVKRPGHRASFDTLFDLWFPATHGDGRADSRASREPGAVAVPAGIDPEVQALREQLANLLLEGDENGLRQFARAAVGRLGRADAQRGRQSWFSYPVLRAMSVDTLMAGLLRAILTSPAGDVGEGSGGVAERVARQTFRDRMTRFEELVVADVRRRIAEENGIDTIARAAVRPPLEQVDFLRATRADLAALRREVYPLARRLATRLSARHKRWHRGRLDFRRTVRASLSTGGVPVQTHHKPRRPHKPELVVLCDTSDSVASFAHFTLLLTYALREQFTKVRAFAFIDTVDEVTRFFAPGADVVDAMARLAQEADLVWLSGRSNYGHAFSVFADRYLDAIGPKTSLLILGDARTNYQALEQPILRRMAAGARHAYWLNPEPRAQWDTGDSAAAAYAEVVPMYECRNVTQLTDFIESIA